ncbi:MAG: UDP-N-acetylglucosamine 4,6-dehydratase (inverting) [Nitrospiraceae bacterium]
MVRYKKSLLNDKVILLTGGTGSFGRAFTKIVLNEYGPKAIRIFSRGEYLQMQMRQQFGDDPRLRFFIGDVRDKDRVYRAMEEVDIVVHAAALKQVPACEYNPIEAVKTNIEGTANVIDAALDNNIERAIFISSDKAVNPINLYGATKLVAEKIFVQANAYRGTGSTRFSCARYGNVVGSRGSVIPLFLQQRKNGKVTVTDSRMTRFWITLEQGVRFVIWCIEHMHGGEVFVPKIPSMNIMDLVKAIAPDCEVEFVGIRPGEKLHEVLISEDESRHTLELDNMFIIQSAHPWWKVENWSDARPVPEGFRYASNTNDRWLTIEELQQMVQELELE